MTDFAIFWDWLSFAVRWLHVITGIAWIGSSFYFVALDLGLRQRPGLPAGAFGEEWQVHGGGFYHIQKYLVAPAEMPEHLTWFKWESYATWLSGFAMLVRRLLRRRRPLPDRPQRARRLADGRHPHLARLASALGWIVYDQLCKSPLGKNDTALMLVLYAILVFMAWGLTQLFTGRAAFLHLGAITATIMSANVFMVIIPNQKIVVADLIAGRKPDPKYGKIAKTRSLHNNYLTLPVLFLMLSNHYPLAFATEFNWVIASLVFIIGVLIRHYFNTKHARKGNPTWTWLVAAILFVIIIWLSTVPKVLTGEPKVSAAEQTLSPRRISRRCATRCSAAARCAMRPSRAMKASTTPRKAWCWRAMPASPSMPAKSTCRPAAATPCRPAMSRQITPEERALIVAWFEEARK